MSLMGKGSLTIGKKDVIQVRLWRNGFYTVVGGETKIVASIKKGGVFNDKALVLNPDYDYVLGRDSVGCIVLLPIKKKEECYEG